MSGHRTEGRRANRRAFQPALEGGGLETRVLLTNGALGRFLIDHPKIGVAYKLNDPKFLAGSAPKFPRGFNGTPHTAIFTAHGGQSANVVVNGGGFQLQLVPFIATPVSGLTSTTTLQPTVTGGETTATSGTSQPVQVAGTIRVYPTGDGTVGVILDGTNSLTELDINPLPFPQRKGYATSFAYGYAGRTRTLDISSIYVSTGNIGAILGYHTANLSGPLTADNTSPIDRIAFNELLPGSSITTTSDVNTFDVLGDADITTAPGLSFGRDLNFMDIGGDLTLSNGGNFLVGRTLGAVPQPVKGTETGITTVNSTLTNQLEAGGIIQGNLTVNPGSTFTITRDIAPSVNGSQAAVLNIRGNLAGANRVFIPNAELGTNLIINGSITNT